MGLITSDLRKEQLNDFYIDIEYYSKEIYDKIKISDEVNHKILYEQLGQLHYEYYTYMEKSLFFHIKYIETGSNIYYYNLNELFTNCNDRIESIMYAIRKS